LAKEDACRVRLSMTDPMLPRFCFCRLLLSFLARRTGLSSDAFLPRFELATNTDKGREGCERTMEQRQTTLEPFRMTPTREAGVKSAGTFLLKSLEWRACIPQRKSESYLSHIFSKSPRAKFRPRQHLSQHEAGEPGAWPSPQMPFPRKQI
jgi:hypothetical protein